MKTKRSSGFTLIELFTTIAITSILIYMASSAGSALYKDYKFNDYASRMEYLTKYSKLYAAQKSTFVGICVDQTKKVIKLKELNAKYASGDNFCSDICY